MEVQAVSEAVSVADPLPMPLPCYYHVAARHAESRHKKKGSPLSKVYTARSDDSMRKWAVAHRHTTVNSASAAQNQTAGCDRRLEMDVVGPRYANILAEHEPMEDSEEERCRSEIEASVFADCEAYIGRSLPASPWASAPACD